MKNELWKPISGYTGIYDVSNFGRVRRIGGWTDGRQNRVRGLLSLDQKRRYIRAILFRDGNKKEFPVHRLVATAFIGPRPLDKEVNHKDGNKHNNHVENLEYVTHSENSIHMFTILGVKTPRGYKHWASKLTDQDVIRMRILRSNGWSLKGLAIEFSISEPTVCEITKRRSWKHI